MPSSPLAPRSERGRSATWPSLKPTRRVGTAEQRRLHKSPSAPATAMPPIPSPKPDHQPFEDELDKHPEDHFLSPVSMYEYDDWADSDSEDDDDEVIEWNAGITDFALFDTDRRRAEARHEHVPNRWDYLLSSQASALQRAVERNRAESQDSQRGRPWTPLFDGDDHHDDDDVPQLTPDNSPDMRDDSHLHTYCGPRSAARRPAVPHLEITPPEDDDSYDDDDDDDDEDSEDDELPISVLIERARTRRQAALKRERPGLRFTRTMSGKSHSWRRPGRQIYSVGEDPEAERKAEQLCFPRAALVVAPCTRPHAVGPDAR